MNELNKALDDLDGLHEAFHALSDPLRKSPLVSNAKLVKKLRHDLAAGADAYASKLISSSRGELDAKRIRKCRKEALSRMPVAVALASGASHAVRFEATLSNYSISLSTAALH